MEEAIADVYSTKDEMKAYYSEQGKAFPENLEFEFTYDVPSFLSKYAKFISLARLSHATGINQGLLSHYITGRKHPRKSTLLKIQKGVHSLGKDLSEVDFV
jgi:hypothetical protein